MAVALVVVIASISAAQRKSPRTVQRAKPPQWTRAQLDLFFPDVRQVLKGPRPAKTDRTPAGRRVPVPGTDPKIPAGVGFVWSKLVSADTLENEVKLYNERLQQAVTTPGKYKAGGYKEGRKALTALALAFAVIGEHDGDVRWKRDAAGWRDEFARAGFNSKVGSTGAYNEAKRLKRDLADLVRGETIEVKSAKSGASWPKVLDRPQLMKRLGDAFDKRLKVALASAGDFKANRERVRHEAEIIAMLAEIMTREGIEDFDDEDYVAIARRMQIAARQLVESIGSANYAQASKAAAVMTKSCSACHEEYR